MNSDPTIIASKVHDLGDGFSDHRLLPSAQAKRVGSVLFSMTSDRRRSPLAAAWMCGCTHTSG